ncbi:MAG: hypothetical protein JW953_00645 [Anaerolineae bacterium]|nr:hypothetical protein [Anaerolineae bacterium]
MFIKKFDPHKFIDREFEQELFEELLQFKDQARILAIRDAGGMGKTQLLHKFQYRCRVVKPSTPVSLVALDQLPDSSPLALVQEIEKDLAARLNFPTFAHYETARRACDFTTIRGAIDLRYADLHDAEVKMAGVMTIIEHAETVSGAAPPTFTPEQQAMAQTLCVQAFLADLSRHCQEQRVVIMLDAYETCDPALRQWLLDHLLDRYCFNIDRRPPQLVVVIAGREIPEFEYLWPSEDCQAVVKSVRTLSQWTTNHVEECLRVHGFSYTQRQLKLFCDMVEQGLSPSQVVDAMRTILLPLRPGR